MADGRVMRRAGLPWLVAAAALAMAIPLSATGHGEVTVTVRFDGKAPQ